MCMFGQVCCRITTVQIVILTACARARSAKVLQGSREAIFRPIFTDFGTLVYCHTEITTGFDGMGFLCDFTILYIDLGL